MKERLEIIHQSSKEERDYILEYQSIDISTRPKLNLAGVEFENVSRDKAIAIILDLIKKKEKFHHILLLDPIKLALMLPGRPLHRITKKASMILPSASGLGWAAKKFSLEFEEIITPISLIMDLIRISEKQGLTLFFLGGTEKAIEKLFFNLTKHFPQIRIVGRHSGKLSKERELMVKEAIRKTSPDIIFLGFDFPYQEIWIENNNAYLGKSIVIGIWNNLDTLAGKSDSTPEYFRKRNLTWLWKVISRPWNLKQIFITLHFYFYFLFLGLKHKKEDK